MVRIGLAGIGFMGMIHFLATQKVPGAKITAICSRDKRKLAGDWRGIKGNFGPPGQVMDLSGIHAYDDYQTLLDDPSIDLIDLCTPTDQHAPMAIAALKAGKHVLVEKAIALNSREADQMLAAAKKAGKLLMVGHVLPFFSEFAFAHKLIEKGEHGRLVAAHFTRVISKPEWSEAIGDAAKTGGPAVDLHVHDTHFVSLIAGVPGKVFSTGHTVGDSVEYLTTSYLYGDNGPTITCSSGAIAMAGRSFLHGFEIYLEDATLAFSSAGTPLTLFPRKGKPKLISLKSQNDPINAFQAEITSAVTAIKAGEVKGPLDAQLARDALVLCLKEIESVLCAKPVIVSKNG
jgi:predicted dehydrogenase